MKKIITLLFTSLLLGSMFIGCGSDDDDDSSTTTVKIPGGGSVSTKTINPSTGDNTPKTGTSSNTGCEDSNGALPGCAK